MKKVKEFMIMGYNRYLNHDGTIEFGPGPYYSDTLRGAKILANKNEYWNNWNSRFEKPTIYKWYEPEGQIGRYEVYFE